MMMSKREEMELKIKEFGKPIFKSKGKKKKVLDETKNFINFKLN